MKTKLLLLLILVILLASTLSSCSSNLYAATSWPGVTVHENTAYVAYNQHIYSINLETGVEIKRYPEKADRAKTFYAAPVLTPDGAQLIAAGYDKVLYSLDPVTLEEKNAFKGATHRYIASPLVTETGIYAANTDGNLYALDFQFQPLWDKPFPAGQPLWAAPVANAECGCLYLTSMDTYLFAIDIATGGEKWKLDLGAASVGAPAIGEDGTLYVSTFSEMLAINPASREIAFRYKTDGMVWSGPAYADGRLYFGDIKGTFYVLEASTLGEIKKITTDGTIVSTPLVTPETVYVTTQAGSLYTFDRDGNELRSPQKFGIEKVSELYAPAVAYGNQILLTPSGVNEMLLYAVDANGNQSWAPFAPAK